MMEAERMATDVREVALVSSMEGVPAAVALVGAWAVAAAVATVAVEKVSASLGEAVRLEVAEGVVVEELLEAEKMVMEPSEAKETV